MGRCVQCESLYIINYQDVAAEKVPNKKGVPYLTPERHQLNVDQSHLIFIFHLSQGWKVLNLPNLLLADFLISSADVGTKRSF